MFELCITQNLTQSQGSKFNFEVVKMDNLKAKLYNMFEVYKMCITSTAFWFSQNLYITYTQCLL